MRRGAPLTTAAWALLALGACSERAQAPPEHRVPGGDPERGLLAIRTYGCDLCHAIPGVEGDPLIVGPPLEDWTERQYIAGELPNRAENLVLWIRDPHAVEPGTAMPTLGIAEREARDIAAYLYTLGRANPPLPVDSPRAERAY